MRKILLIIGNDNISKKIINHPDIPENVVLVKDESTTFRRVWKLLCKKRINLKFLLKTFFCELKRYKITRNKKTKIPSIKSNQQVIELIRQLNPQYVLLFRAGLIINKSVLNLGIPLLNIHCAKIPEFGGLASVERALKAKKYNQCATLHKVTESIDKGEIISELSFKLSNDKSYCCNEDIAFHAGFDLLLKVLRGGITLNIESIS